MQEAVSAILQDRSRQVDGLNRMLMLSLGAHLVLVAALALSPAGWFSRPAEDQPVMSISLGGTVGPDTGGLTTMADKAIQEIAKPNAPKVFDAPPAAKTPEMVESTATPKPAPTRTIKKPADTSKARAPSTGAEIKTGSARVTTGGAAIPFGGLAQGGGGAGGVRVDVANFCCPEYLTQMVAMVRQNWSSNQGAGGQPVVKFTIRRDGVIVAIELERSSGQDLLDLEARRAVVKTQRLLPLPREFTESSLTVHLTFDFQR
jgi:TonB family protein